MKRKKRGWIILQDSIQQISFILKFSWAYHLLLTSIDIKLLIQQTFDYAITITY